MARCHESLAGPNRTHSVAAHCIVVRLRSTCAPAMHPPSPTMAGVVDAPASPAQQRLVSLDAFRGFIMIVLSCGGFGLAKTAELHLKADPDSHAWSAVLQQFEHGEWAGWGFWDLIMPAFMFMVGMALPFSLQRRLREGH